MNDSVEFGSKKIRFNLEYTNRKSLGISVTPDLKVFVRAPVDATLKYIKEKIKKKAPWIIKQQNFFLTFHPKLPERKYISGESHLYLGKEYRLKIIKNRSEMVKLNGNFIEVFYKDKNKVRKLLNKWYHQNAKIKFPIAAKKCIQKFKKYNVSPSSVVLSYMKTRWGSCTRNGKIILNPELIKTPRRCIEYVIIHELCHLIHSDHTKKFFDLLSKEMPDWMKWKMKLEKLLA